MSNHIETVPVPATTEQSTGPSASKVYNIWYSTRENTILSNLSERRFQYNGRMYISVEHAYQSLKSGEFDVFTYRKYTKPGMKVRGLPAKEKDGYNIRLMKSLIKESLVQNPNVLKCLLATGNNQLTHNQDRGIWKTVFPRLLMELRTELNPSS